MLPLFTRMCRELEMNQPLVLATIVHTAGSAPRGTGSQMLVGTQGRILGTIGGGAVEYEAEQMCRELLARKKSLCHDFCLRRNPGEDIGMVCGGDVRVWMQYIPGDDPLWPRLAASLTQRIKAQQPGWLVLRLDGGSPGLLDGNGTVLAGQCGSDLSLTGQGCMLHGSSFSISLPLGERAIIFGGGHCAQALAPLLGTVGFRVTVMDPRPEFARRELFPTAEQILCGDYLHISRHLTLTPEDYVVVMTSGHSHDFAVQEQVLQHPLAYIGVIGSRKKTAAVNAMLRTAGISQEAIDTVHTPIGTAIKAVTPAEIAVSIAGEMIYERALRREAAGVMARGCPMHE